MGGEYHGWLNCSGFLRDPLEYSRILSNPPEYGTRERNATKMGRQCDDGGGMGGCGGAMPADDWRGRGVARIGGIPPRSTGTAPGSRVADGGLNPMRLQARNPMTFARSSRQRKKPSTMAGLSEGGGSPVLVV